MAVRVTHWRALGNGTVQVFGRSDAGNDLSIVVGHDKLGTDIMYLVLERRAVTVDSQVAALDARKGGTEHD